MKNSNFLCLLSTFSCQMLRACNGRHHPAVTHSFAFDNKAKISGAVLWYPSRDVSSSRGTEMEQSEEVISINDLAIGMSNSTNSENLKPCLTNCNDPIGCNIRDNFSVKKHCFCKSKAAVKKTMTSKNGNKDRLFHCCAKDENNPLGCSFSQWKTNQAAAQWQEFWKHLH